MKLDVLTARSPTWGNRDKTAISLVVRFAHLPDCEVPFSATPDDSAEHGRELYTRALFGEFGPVGEFTESPPTEDEQLAVLDSKLKHAATTMAPLEDADKLGVISEREKVQLTAWQHYRVALYRLPQSEGWPTDVTWPDAPQ
ncbi:tail fiber assembly protein [Aeromonas enteropelogenes]|uniref:tail fiber assembly protein n=2 Tax=Aeromonas enteropelogenes TaxID=29489 RepID=UPI00191D785A|nr:tail fiber assembly protein [Aeromonas enteropelogenes]MBL0521633.1 tail fiber assembly protein [Aeromonas enteropelogenes]